jgi:hypothetical protein
VDATDLRISRFLIEAVQVLTSADSRVWQSFRALLIRPGFLATEHLAGRRKPWLGPVQLFVICNIAFFVFHFFIPAHVFTTRLSDHLYSHVYSPHILGLRTAGGIELWRLVLDPELFRRYAPAFNAATEGLAKSLIIVLVPGFALLLKVVNLGRRYFVEHLVLSFHFYAALMLSVMAVMFGMWSAYHVGRFAGYDISPHLGDGFFSSIVVILLLLWLVPALRAFYHQRWAAAMLSGLLLVVGQLFLLFGYRFLLLLLTLRAV